MAWETETKIFGLPLFSIGGKARGIIAIGAYASGFLSICWIGRGVITFAQFGYGVVFIGQFGLGIFSVAQFAAGYFILGQFALGLIFAMGQFALGCITVGAGWGYYSAGGNHSLEDTFRITFGKVLDNPVPFIVWISFLAAASAYVFMKRGSISRGMSPLDFFRPQIRHSLDRIRSKALGKLGKDGKLLAVAKNDPSMEVRRSALGRIHDPLLLSEFIAGDNPLELKLLALSRIGDERLLMVILKKTADEELRWKIAGHLKKEENMAQAASLLKSRKTRTAVMAKITDQVLLVNFLIQEADLKTAQALMGNVTSPQDIRKIARQGKFPGSRIAALEAAGEGEGDLFREASRNDGDDSVKITALKRVEDKEVLRGIMSGGFTKKVRDAASARMEEIRPFTVAFRMEMSCPSCSQPLFLNGPVRNMKCSFCLVSVKIKDGVWKSMLNSGWGVTRVDRLDGLIIDKGEGSPGCRHCGAPLDTDDVPPESAADVICGGCGKGNSSFPLPEWFPRSEHANHVFCADRDTGDSDMDTKKEPVAVSCIKCGGPLEITEKTPRTTRCGYCNTMQYLPDPLWLSFHPVKTKRSWYIRFSFRERQKGRCRSRGAGLSSAGPYPDSTLFLPLSLAR